jgi:hypothetical protein
LARAVAVFAYAVCALPWNDPMRLDDSAVRNYLASLIRRLKREMGPRHESIAAG